MPSPLIRCLAVLALACLPATATLAQSLSPMEKSGVTPSSKKAFRLMVSNPYQQKMTFVLLPYLPDFDTPTKGVEIKPDRVTMAPGFTRPVIVTFDIDPTKKERTIALCVMPEDLAGPILPRVCGRYTGRIVGPGG